MDSFAERALRLAGVACVLFGWTPGQFWGATPAELAALLHVMAGDAPATTTRAELGRLMEMFPDG